MSDAELQRLVRLQRADDARQHAEHAAFGAARCELGRRRLREEAAVARTLVRLEDRHLALEAEDRAVHDGDVVEDRCVVDQVARREVVGAVHDHVPAVGEDAVDVLGGDALLVRHDLDVGVERLERLLRRVGLPVAEPLGRVRDLALQIRGVDAIVVDDADPADAGGGEIEAGGAAEASGADQEDARLEQLQLTLDADFGNQEVAAVARALFRVERVR